MRLGGKRAPITGGAFRPGRWLFTVQPIVSFKRWGIVILRQQPHDGTNPFERKPDA